MGSEVVVRSNEDRRSGVVEGEGGEEEEEGEEGKKHGEREQWILLPVGGSELPTFCGHLTCAMDDRLRVRVPRYLFT